MESLDLARNEIFDIKTLTNFCKLKELSLKSNQFTNVPKEILKMQNLEKFDISYNDLKTISFGITLTKPKLPPLKHLNISMNNLSKFPLKIIDFKSLQYLDISRNKFSEIPSDITKLTDLKTLIMEEADLEVFPQDLVKMTTLEKLNLSKNPLTQLQPIGQMAGLKELYLSFCKLTSFDISWSTLNSLTELRILHLNDNFLTILKPNLSKLKELKINKNKLKEITADIENCPNLEMFDASANQIASIKGLEKLTLLTKVDLSINQITSINLVNAAQLEEIDLSTNQLTNLWDFSKHADLKKLTVKNNKLTAFPKGIEKCQNLECLDLTYNHVKEIPEEVTCLPKIHFLRLKHNDIDIIPKSISKMKQLSDLNLDHNGVLEIPEEIIGCDALKTLCLSYNAPKGLKMSEKVSSWIESKPLTVTKEFEYCSKIIDGVYLSSAAAASNKHHLRDLGVTHVLTVAHDIPPPHPDKFGYYLIYVEDVRAASLIPHFDDTCRFIDEVLSNGGSVCIHCMAGVSRSATVTCSFLMYKNKWKVKQAFNFLYQQRNIVSPNETFKKELQYFEKVIFGQAQLSQEMKIKNLYELVNIKECVLSKQVEADRKKYMETKISIDEVEKKQSITPLPVKKKAIFKFGSTSEDGEEIRF